MANWEAKIKTSWEHIKFIALKVLCIVILLLLPGIRGYDNLQIYEYLIFVVVPIIGIIFFWKKDSNKNPDRGITE